MFRLSVPRFVFRLYDISNVRPSSTKVHQSSTIIDNFISSVQNRYVIRTERIRNTNTISSNRHKKNSDIIPIIIVPIESTQVGTNADERGFIRPKPSNKEDAFVDEIVLEALEKTGLEGALLKLNYYAPVNRYPARKTLKILARLSAEAGNSSSITVIQGVCKKAFPKESIWQMQYMHYYAEALWKSGQHKESIATFEKLLLEHTQRRRKISNMLTFLARNILQNDLEEELTLLVESVKRCGKAGTNQAAANVWFQLFISPSGRKQLLATDIVKTCEQIKPLIINKVDSVLISAKDLGSDVLYRFIEVLLFLKATTECAKVYNALLDSHCNEGNAVSAVETFQHMKQENIPMDFGIFLNFRLFLIMESKKKSTPIFHYLAKFKSC